jgi:hypothetical protein
MPLLDSAHKVVKVTLSGTMLGGQEMWQTGFYVGSATQDAAVPNQAYADAVRDAWVTFWQAASTPISSTYIFTGVKLARLLKNGDYDAGDVIQSFPTPAKPGASAAGQLPPQCSLVATLVAGSGKGLAGKGRMYLPGVNASMDATGHITTLNAQNTATNLAAFFNTINGSFDAPGEVINVSRGHKNLLGVGARNVPINGIRVGNVYDTQRRRRNALAETYSTAVVND